MCQLDSRRSKIQCSKCSKFICSAHFRPKDAFYTLVFDNLCPTCGALLSPSGCMRPKKEKSAVADIDVEQIVHCMRAISRHAEQVACIVSRMAKIK